MPAGRCLRQSARNGCALYKHEPHHSHTYTNHKFGALGVRSLVTDNDTSWEPEYLIQEDAPLLWEQCVATKDHRAVLGPRERQM